MDGQLAAQRLDALAHADVPEAAAAGPFARREARTVVADDERDPALFERQRDRHLARLGVLDRVVERLLPDTEQMVFGLGRERARRAQHLQAGPQRRPRRHHVHQLAQGVRQALVLQRVRAQGEDGAPRLGQAVLGQVAGLGEGGQRLLRLAREGRLGQFQVDEDAGESLGKRVMNLAGQPVALLQHCRLLALLRQARQLESERGLLGERQRQFVSSGA